MLRLVQPESLYQSRRPCLSMARIWRSRSCMAVLEILTERRVSLRRNQHARPSSKTVRFDGFEPLPCRMHCPPPPTLEVRICVSKAGTRVASRARDAVSSEQQCCRAQNGYVQLRRALLWRFAGGSNMNPQARARSSSGWVDCLRLSLRSFLRTASSADTTSSSPGSRYRRSAAIECKKPSVCR